MFFFFVCLFALTLIGGMSLIDTSKQVLFFPSFFSTSPAWFNFVFRKAMASWMKVCVFFSFLEQNRGFNRWLNTQMKDCEKGEGVWGSGQLSK